MDFGKNSYFCKKISVIPMRTIYYPDCAQLEDGYAATVGFFDGVHRGHCYLVNRLKDEAAKRGLRTMVVTFDCHPRQVVQSSWQPRLLSTLDEKCGRFSQTGIDTLVVLRFDEAMAKLSAREFMGRILMERLGVKMLLTGYDNRFGHNREEDFADYVHYGKALGMEVVGCDPFSDDSIRISSSCIRRLLDEGKVEEANRCLGYPYTISGRVGHGEQIGRTMGFPTANLVPDDEQKLIPREGAYAVMVSIGQGLPSNGNLLHGMTNIGTRPTFDGSRQTLETNIFDTTGDFYDQPISIRLMARLRDERSFASAEELARQLEKDKQDSIKILKRLTEK